MTTSGRRARTTRTRAASSAASIVANRARSSSVRTVGGIRLIAPLSYAASASAGVNHVQLTVSVPSTVGS